MVAALPEATTATFTPQQEFANLYGNMVGAEQALEVTAQEYMASEYTTGGDRMEAIVAPLLIARWRHIHDDMIGDIAWIAIFRDDHKDYCECRPPGMTMIDPGERDRHLDDAYRQLALHLEIPGLVTLLEAQEGRTVHQAGIAIQSKLTEHIRITDYQRRRRPATEYHRSNEHREHMAIQLSNLREYTGEGVVDRGSLDEKGLERYGLLESNRGLPARANLHPEGCMADRQRSQRGHGRERQRGRGRRRHTRRLNSGKAAKQDDWPRRPSSPGHSDNCGDGTGAPDEPQGPLAEAGGIGHHQTAMRKEAESAKAEEGSPTAGETAPEMVHTVRGYGPTQPPRPEADRDRHAQ
jgi:hypothetical protein